MAGQVAVIGAGLMGSGIAQVAAQAGWRVALTDVEESAVARGVDTIRASLSRFAAKGQLDGDVAEILGRITPGVGLEAAA